MTIDIDATTTFYALTAPVKGYTLEYQALGGMTLRDWLKHFSGSDAEDKLADHIMYFVHHGERYWLTEAEANEYNQSIGAFCSVEAFTAAELLNRLRLDAMDEEGYIR